MFRNFKKTSPEVKSEQPFKEEKKEPTLGELMRKEEARLDSQLEEENQSLENLKKELERRIEKSCGLVLSIHKFSNGEGARIHVESVKGVLRYDIEVFQSLFEGVAKMVYIRKYSSSGKQVVDEISLSRNAILDYIAKNEVKERREGRR